MLKMNVKLVQLLMTSLLISGCSYHAPRNLKEAQEQAISNFKDIMFELDIDVKYFDGPTFIAQDEQDYTFVWISTISEIRSTIIEVFVSKNQPGVGYRTIGRSKSYLCGTCEFPLNEAALCNLFRLRSNPKIKASDKARQLRIVPFAPRQLEDIANFIEIRHDIEQYMWCFNLRYPDSLSYLHNIDGSSCAVEDLDSIYTHDRYGHQYYYENFINFVVLGTPGADRKWDFAPAVIDSIYNDSLEHIYVKNDDIIVKLIPKSLGCD